MEFDNYGKIKTSLPTHLRNWIGKNPDILLTDELDKVAKKYLVLMDKKQLWSSYDPIYLTKTFEDKVDAEPCKIPFDKYEMDLKNLTIEKRTHKHLWSKTLPHKLWFKAAKDLLNKKWMRMTKSWFGKPN